MPGIVKFNCALGESFSTVIMNEIMPENRGMNKVDHTSTDTHTIPVIAIDGLGLEDIDLIQFDIEGYENKALIGATDTIKRNRPVIIVESAINNDAEAYRIVEGILRDMSYSPLKQITRLDTVFVPD
jgi:FkbM family methyltransferase